MTGGRKRRVHVAEEQPARAPGDARLFDGRRRRGPEQAERSARARQEPEGWQAEQGPAAECGATGTSGPGGLEDPSASAARQGLVHGSPEEDRTVINNTGGDGALSFFP